MQLNSKQLTRLGTCLFLLIGSFKSQGQTYFSGSMWSDNLSFFNPSNTAQEHKFKTTVYAFPLDYTNKTRKMGALSLEARLGKTSSWSAGAVVFHNTSMVLNPYRYYSRSTQVKLNLAKHLKLARGGQLSLGASIGRISHSQNTTDWVTIDPAWLDPAIPQEFSSDAGLDVGLGISYQSEKMRIGFSSSHLNSFTYIIENFESTYQTVERLFAEYKIKASEKIDVIPSVLFTNNYLIDGNFGLRGMYKEKLWIGMNYGYKESVSFQGGLNISKFSLGYSIINRVSSQTQQDILNHEFSLSFMIK